MSAPVNAADAPVALLTQCADYVGPALARVLGREGMRLVLHGARDELLAELHETGVEAVGCTGKLTTAEANRAVVRHALDTYGRIDAACFVTGLIVAGPFLDVTTEEWDGIKQLNLDMVFHALQAVLPPMLEAGRGQVVIFTSATGARPEPGVSIYSATRAGANALVRAVGLEMAPHGVNVNAIGTNFMDFPGFVQATGATDPEVRARIEKRVPARRLGTLEELAEFTAVLLDGRSRFQAGQFFSFSGGWSA